MYTNTRINFDTVDHFLCYNSAIFFRFDVKFMLFGYPTLVLLNGSSVMTKFTATYVRGDAGVRGNAGVRGDAGVREDAGVRGDAGVRRDAGYRGTRALVPGYGDINSRIVEY